MIQRFLPAGAALVALATCATAPSTAYYQKGLCEEKGLKSADGLCRSYYSQRWDEAGVSTAVLTFCRLEGPGSTPYGAGVAGFSGQSEHGVALRWLADDQLEVAVAPGGNGQRVDELRWYSDDHIERARKTAGSDGSAPKLEWFSEANSKTTGKPEPTVADGVSLVRTVRISYRDLTPKDPEWRHSCYAKRPKAKAP